MLECSAVDVARKPVRLADLAADIPGWNQLSRLRPVVPKQFDHSVMSLLELLLSVHGQDVVTDDVVHGHSVNRAQHQAPLDEDLQPPPDREDGWTLDRLLVRAGACLEDHGKGIERHDRILRHEREALEERDDVVLVGAGDRFE